MAATAGVIAVGDELLAGRILDTNARFLSARLTALGFRVRYQIAVGDGSGELGALLASPAADAEAVIVTGGLGPTEDDRTRAEIAAALGVALEFRAETWEQIAARLRARGVDPNPRNRSQAYFPAGADVVTNRHGSAPAFRVTRPGGEIWALPGVPAEMESIFEEEVAPALARSGAAPSAKRETLRFFGVPESHLDAWFVERLLPNERADYHIRVHDGEVEVELPSGVSLAAAAAERFPGNYLGTGGIGLPERLVAVARSAGLTIATAESCTGGLVASRITSAPGASAVFLGGWVVYSNALKSEQLQVPPALLGRHGAVSAEVAVGLARAARDEAHADLALSVTGIAGPDGGTPEKPVGTVYLGLAGPSGFRSRRLSLAGGREQIRSRTAGWGLHALWAAAAGAPLAGWSTPSG